MHDDHLPPTTRLERDPPIRPRAALLALPPAVFLLHFAAVYAFTGLACAFGWHTRPLGPFALVPVIVLGLTVVALCALVLTLPRAPGRPAPDATQPHDPVARSQFLATATRRVSWLAMAGMVVVALPSLLMEACA